MAVNTLLLLDPAKNLSSILTPGRSLPPTIVKNFSPMGNEIAKFNTLLLPSAKSLDHYLIVALTLFMKNVKGLPAVSAMRLGVV